MHTHSTSSSKVLALSDPDWVRWSLVGVSLVVMGLFLILPLATVLIAAFAKGWSAYAGSLSHPDTLRSEERRVGKEC